jgi:hypothetical protein
MPTVEAAGEFLGLDTDRGLHAYFRRHFGHLFTGLRAVHRGSVASLRIAGLPAVASWPPPPPPPCRCMVD